MCGIVGIVGSGPVRERLLAGLKRLEYRGYDSAGIAVIDDGGALRRRRAPGKLANLDAAISADPVEGRCGIAHTRWATHGAPTEDNAHPHQSGSVAVVHNGIIENFRELKRELEAAGHVFASETDSEVIAHLIEAERRSGKDMTAAFSAAIARLRGAYGIAAVCADEPDRLWAAREGSPLVVGLGDGESFIGSDALALAGLTRYVIYLEEGDWVAAGPEGAVVRDRAGREVSRPVQLSRAVAGFADKGEYRHFMEKEIHEQPDALSRTLAGYVDAGAGGFRSGAEIDWRSVRRVVFSACGTAFYACQIAKGWFERQAGLIVDGDVASEFRYREPILGPDDLAVFVSQSGETADTLAALRYAKSCGARTLALVNVPDSTLAREADAVAMTEAGPEIGVASTKAFTAQLAALAGLACAAGVARGVLDDAEAAALASALLEAPRRVNEALALEPEVEALARGLMNADDVLYLGRGAFFPLALEGALKLKEISYIHAEGYPGGELKHGPIALIEDGSPVVVVAPKDALFGKMMSNVEEVIARGAQVILITDQPGLDEAGALAAHSLVVPTTHPLIQPIVAAVPIQLLAYHTAALKGTDVDQPRNLAKSVTVE
ncbi:MAG: glutamine--fructose-6-phosphate transaminase (isomerizing) [Alphaproteobacteria bacterium]|nr:glutamine--fructose-6-phosphate transaminase (isomerizing) [Alphaproteobacteria bacterium]